MAGPGFHPDSGKKSLKAVASAPCGRPDGSYTLSSNPAVAVKQGDGCEGGNGTRESRAGNQGRCPRVTDKGRGSLSDWILHFCLLSLSTNPVWPPPDGRSQ